MSRSAEIHRTTNETDVELTLEKLEKREAKLEALEKRLSAKEAELASYVAQAQSSLHTREADWWKKVLGPEEVESR